MGLWLRPIRGDESLGFSTLARTSRRPLPWSKNAIEELLDREQD